MTLRRKTLLIIGITLLSLNSALYMAVSTILMRSYTKAEEQDTHQNVARTLSVFNNTLEDLDLSTIYWASWDATYAFAGKPTTDYLTENFSVEIFEKFGQNLISLTDASGQIILTKTYDLQARREIPAPSNLQKVFATNPSIWQHSDIDSRRTGVLILPEGVFAFASRPITTSLGKGPIRGSVVLGFRLDPAKVQDLSRTIRLPLHIHLLNEEQLPPDFEAARRALSDKTPIFVQPLNSDTVAGYALLPDVSGKSGLILRVDTPRLIYKQGQHTARYFLMFFLAVELAFGAVILLLLEKLVLSRLSRLSIDVDKVGADGNLSTRVMMPGKDELSHLANAINWMLNRLNQSQEELQKSQERYRAFVDQSSEGIWRLELELPFSLRLSKREQIKHLYQHSYLAESNDIWAQMYGFPSGAEVVGIKLTELQQHWRLRNTKILSSFIQSGYRLTDAEFRACDSNGNLKHFVCNLIGIVENDYLIRVWGTQRDITPAKQAEEARLRTKIVEAANEELTKEINQRRQVEQALFQEKELAQVTLHSIGDAVVTTDALGLIKSLNPVAEKMTGWQSQDAQSSPLMQVFRIVDEVSHHDLENPVEKALRENRIITTTTYPLLVARDGREFAIEHSVAPIHASDGRSIGTVLVFRDVTESRKLAQDLSWQASHDPLTELFNRRAFEQCLGTAAAGPIPLGQQHALLYLDLDQFKIVNDTCGHIAGDELLRQVATVFQTHVQKTDVLARLGGDEFGLLLYQCQVEKALRVAQTLREEIQGFRYVWQDKVFSLSTSIGVVMINGDENLSSVLSAADAACYAAKNKGRNRVHVYQMNDSELTTQRVEMQWAARIPKALEENRFRLYCQPIVAVAEATASDFTPNRHYEVLLRLEDEAGEIVSPMAFIPAAERYNLMHLIDRWVIRTLFAHLGQYAWKECASKKRDSSEAKDFHTHYAVNLSGASVNDECFINFVEEQFSLYHIPPQMICFEITETLAIANLSKAAQFIRQLKTLGCSFSLDDFGSGMSSFAYLKNLPVDYLKIDGTFVRDIVQNPVTCEIVEAINRIGHAIGMQTVAEFVENDDILMKLRILGVDYAQGYGIAKPYPFVLG